MDREYMNFELRRVEKNGGDLVEIKELRSIHVDLEKKIYEINGEPMSCVRELNLVLDADGWSLRISKDEWFTEGSRRLRKRSKE